MMVLVIDFMRSTPFLIDQRKLMVSLAVNVFRIQPKRNHATAHSCCQFEPSWLFFIKEGDLVNVEEKRKAARRRLLLLVELKGIEPLTSGLQSPRSPS